MDEPVICTVSLPDEAATVRLGQTLANALPDPYSGWLILLQGELGAGKSTLVRALLLELGHTGTVPSPTYTLVEPYEFSAGPVYHVDLYRIVAADELEFLGWSELREGLLLVEWPERVPTLIDESDLLITLAYDFAGRTAELTPQSARAAAWLGKLSARLDTMT